MIHVLQVVNAADRGGAETMAMNLYRNINRNEIQFGFTNHSGRKAAYDDEIEALGGEIFKLPKFKGYNYGAYVKAWRQLLREHPEYKIIHIHNYNIAGIVSRIAREEGVLVRITHSHSTRLNLPWLKKCVFHLLHSSMMKNSTDFFSCGVNAGRFMFGKHNFTVVSNGLDTSRFLFNPKVRESLRQQLGVDEFTKVYGHVGSFRTPKNHTFLINIFKEIHRIDSSARLVLIGSGELLDAIHNQTKQLGLEDSVIFLGQQSNVNQWLSALDVFIMPSLWEGLPVSVVEAQCAGLPCVISDVIDHDVNLTGHVKFIRLDLSAQYWANEIMSIKPTNRVDMGNIVTESSYNIDKVTAQLSKFYKESL